MALQLEQSTLLASLLAEQRRVDPWPKAVAVLLAQGVSPSDIARAFGESPERVNSIVQSESVRDLVSKIQAGLGLSAEQKLAANLGAAIDILASSLHSGSVKMTDKIKVAQDIIDRVQGKPVQTTQSIVGVVTANTPDKVVNSQLAAMSARLAAIESKKASLRKVVEVTPAQQVKDLMAIPASA